jgi:hypothetical protein
VLPTAGVDILFCPLSLCLLGGGGVDCVSHCHNIGDFFAGFVTSQVFHIFSTGGEREHTLKKYTAYNNFMGTITV